MEYAFFFGAQEATLGASCDNKPHEWTNEQCGAEVMKLMERNIPGIVQVRDAVGKAAERGFLVGLDGRKLFIRKHHAALNNYTQGNGAICCKWAMVRQQQEAKRKGLDQMQVGMYHDETQNDVLPSDAEEFGTTCVQAIRDCGKHFNLKVALDGDYQIAQNWAGSH